TPAIGRTVNRPATSPTVAMAVSARSAGTPIASAPAAARAALARLNQPGMPRVSGRRRPSDQQATDFHSPPVRSPPDVRPSPAVRLPPSNHTSTGGRANPQAHDQPPDGPPAPPASPGPSAAPPAPSTGSTNVIRPSQAGQPTASSRQPRPAATHTTRGAAAAAQATNGSSALATTVVWSA